MGYDLGFRVCGLGFMVYGLGFRVCSLWFRVYGLGFSVYSLGFSWASVLETEAIVFVTLHTSVRSVFILCVCVLSLGRV